MKKILHLICYTFCISTVLKAQSLPEVIPPSPNAASLGQYAEIPVGYYTGVPNISIPLYTVKSGDIEVPITLSYHSNGIKVAQEASWVGLAWALNAGGVITRQVRGKDDFEGGYMIEGPLPISNEFNEMDLSDSNNNYTNHLQYFNQNKDAEPDIFYFNFLNYSGKLVFEKGSGLGGSIYKGTPIDQNNLLFTYNTSSYEWIITDENGWKFYFGSKSKNAVEESKVYSISQEFQLPAGSPVFLTDNVKGYHDGNPQFVENAWYLTKIESEKGRTVEFIYKTKDEINNDYLSLGQISYNESIYNQYDYRFYSYTTNPKEEYAKSEPFTFGNYMYNQQEVKDVYLEQIIFNNGLINLNTEDRLDIKKDDTYETTPQRLANLEIKDLNNKLVKGIDFHYSYFNNNFQTKRSRLKLDSIQEYNSISETKPPYIFSYDETKNLPEKSSYMTDHWGYYNGKSNFVLETTHYDIQDHLVNNTRKILSYPTNQKTKKILAPAFVDPFSYSEKHVFIDGANREPSVEYIQTGILKSITNPIGYTDVFTYEMNDYNHDTETLYNDKRKSAYVSNNIDVDDPLIDDFTLYNYSTVDIRGFIYNNYYFSDPNDNGPIINSTVILEKSDGNPILEFNPPSNPPEEYYNYYCNIVLPPGEYRLRVDSGSYIDGEIELELVATWTHKELTNKKNASGVRIKKIETFENEIIEQKKVFSYEENGFSTGRLVSPLKYFWNETLVTTDIIFVPSGFYKYWIVEQDYLVRSSTSQIPLGTSAQGKAIGYNKVIISNEDGNGISLGKSKYHYKNIEEVPTEYFMPGTPNFVNLSNGQLLKEEHFNENGSIVKEKIINYNKNLSTAINLEGIKYYKPFWLEDPSGNTGFNVRFYDLSSEWWHPESITTTIYDTNGNNPLVTTSTYEYSNPNHKMFTKSITLNSKGESIINRALYPDDIKTSTTLQDDSLIEGGGLNNYAFVGRMKADDLHKVVVPVQSESYFDVNNNGIPETTELLSLNRRSYLSKQSNNDLNNDWIVNSQDQMILLETASSLKGIYDPVSNSLDERIIIHDYYDSGNIKEVSKQDGMHIVYIWGYNKEYPIAMIENVTYSQLSNELITIQNLSNADDDSCQDGQGCNEASLRDALNALRNSLPNSMVTTYTYDPLIGVTSETDPRGETIYYYYDSFNRLEFIKDKDGNILSKNEYNYKN